MSFSYALCVMMSSILIFILTIILRHSRHCEERSDAAIQFGSVFAGLDCFAALAMTIGCNDKWLRGVWGVGFVGYECEIRYQCL
jgi:hypothetical protein